VLTQPSGAAVVAVAVNLPGQVENLSLSAEDRTRWVEFLSYIVALVYHARSADEQLELRDVVDRSVQTDPHRKEYTKMGQTIAEM
jgi:hypothetical protein